MTAVHGPTIIARTLSELRPFGPSETLLQYHSRSDHHSKLACWAIAFDLLSNSALMRKHVEAQLVTIGVNHRMSDFKLRRNKDLDLVIARPSQAAGTKNGATLSELAAKWKVRLDTTEQSILSSLPMVEKQPVGAVLVALEAKACMTEHSKSESRMFDELNSAQQTVHGAADQAVACGLAMINFADKFVSPGRQRAGDPVVVNTHRQPGATASLIDKVRELPRRTSPGTDGFDALGILVINLVNDGSPVSVVTSPPAPDHASDDSYEKMIIRAVSLYDYRFSSL